MRDSRPRSGNRLAIGVLLIGACWLVLVSSGVLKLGTSQLPMWAAFVVVGVLVVAPVLTKLAYSLHWAVRTLTFIFFASSALILPEVANRSPLVAWLALLVTYAEVFWALPKLDGVVSHRQRTEVR